MKTRTSEVTFLDGGRENCFFSRERKKKEIVDGGREGELFLFERERAREREKRERKRKKEENEKSEKKKKERERKD